MAGNGNGKGDAVFRIMEQIGIIKGQLTGLQTKVHELDAGVGLLRDSFGKMADAIADFVEHDNDRFAKLEGRISALEAKP